MSSPPRDTQRCTSPQTGDEFEVLRTHSTSSNAPHPPLAGTSAPNVSVQGWERGWLVLPQQKATGEGQTGEAGTGTRSPPC